MLDQAAPSILVVEGHEGSLGALSEHLARSGYRPRHVEGVGAACALLRTQSFAVVVACLLAPGTESLALLRAAQRTLPRSEVVFRFESLEAGAALTAIGESSAAVLDGTTDAETVQRLVDRILGRAGDEAPVLAAHPETAEEATNLDDTARLERQRAIVRPLEVITSLHDAPSIERFRLSIARASRDATGARHAWVILGGDEGESVAATEPAVEAPRTFVREVRLAGRPLSRASLRPAPGYIGVPVDGDRGTRGAIVVALRPDAEPAPEDVSLLVMLARELAVAEQVVGLRREVAAARDAVLVVLSNALELRDRDTLRHSQRVASLAYDLAVEFGHEDPIPLEELRAGALLHDVGKIGIPLGVLRKQGPLTNEEWEAMQRHPEHGWRLLQGVPHLAGAAELVLVSHERWDGRGYPRGLAGEHIPIAARIFSVADAWDSMTSDRPYRRALPLDEALQELSERSDTQFDPEVVEAFFRLISRKLAQQGGHARSGQPAA